jgi:hypothetical protein
MLSEGLITEKQAQDHPERNVIERALGFTNEDPEITEVTLARGDVLLLCSDGVSTVVNAEAMAKCVVQAANAEDAAENVVSAALKNNTDDNSTAVIAALNWTSHQAGTQRTSRAGTQRASRARRANHRPSKGFSLPDLIKQHLVAIVLALLLLCAGIVIGLWVASGDDSGNSAVEQTTLNNDSA